MRLVVRAIAFVVLASSVYTLLFCGQILNSSEWKVAQHYSDEQYRGAMNPEGGVVFIVFLAAIQVFAAIELVRLKEWGRKGIPYTSIAIAVTAGSTWFWLSPQPLIFKAPQEIIFFEVLPLSYIAVMLMPQIRKRLG